MFDINEIIDNFSFLDDWEDRYRYIIDLGNQILPMNEEDKTEENKVRGCTSQVWIKDVSAKNENGEKIIDFTADSDAQIVKGLIAIVMAIFIGKKTSEVKNINAEDFFAKLDLNSHLSPSRRNGLSAMVEKIKSINAQD